jgi:RimJ/RimL family protein N-acetyltransferase
MQNTLTFQRLSANHDKQLFEWLQLPHVKLFWDDGDRTLEQVRAHYFKQDDVERYLFFIDSQAAGYIQSYSIDASNAYVAYALPNLNNIGMDFFIGNTDFLNRKLATTILAEFIRVHAKQASRIIVDPEPHNLKAIHIYQTAGFVQLGECAVNDKVHLIFGKD